MRKLSTVKTNPNNPRLIKDEAFARLCEKIKRNPDGMRLRPIVIESWANPIIIAGNQRFRALKQLGYKQVPEEWIQSAEAWTEDQRREFLITDNISDGEWEWQMLTSEYNDEELAEWGVLEVEDQVPLNPNEDVSDKKKKYPTLKITFKTTKQLQAAEVEIREALAKRYKGASYSISAGEI